MATQDKWCFCTKCDELFYNGYLLAGVCPAGQQHSPFGEYPSWDFALQIISTSPPPQEAGQPDPGSDHGIHACVARADTRTGKAGKARSRVQPGLRAEG